LGVKAGGTLFSFDVDSPAVVSTIGNLGFAFRTFCERGDEATSMTELLENMGIQKGSF